MDQSLKALLIQGKTTGLVKLKRLKWLKPHLMTAYLGCDIRMNQPLDSSASDMNFKYIYHYTSLEIALAFILPTNRIRFSPLRFVGDPRESKNLAVRTKADPQYTTTDADIKKLKNRRNAIHEYVNNVRRNDFKIACFSLDDESIDITPVFRTDWRPEHLDSGWGIPRMWEQYARKHTGVCLVFDRKVFLAQAKAYRDHLLIFNSPGGLGANFKHADMTYDNKKLARIAELVEKDFPQRHKFEDFLEDDANRRHLRAFLLDNVSDYFFLKSRAYEAEREWRFIYHFGDGKRESSFLHLDFGDSLHEIIAGENVNAFGLNQLFQLV